jgi:hypothetical protein
MFLVVSSILRCYCVPVSGCLEAQKGDVDLPTYQSLSGSLVSVHGCRSTRDFFGAACPFINNTMARLGFSLSKPPSWTETGRIELIKVAAHNFPSR